MGGLMTVAAISHALVRPMPIAPAVVVEATAELKKEELVGDRKVGK